jgi:autotransporter-associated beta strand protein
MVSVSFGVLKDGRNLALSNTGAAAVALAVGNNSQSTTYSGVLSGAGSLTNVGTGTLTLNTASNTYCGGTRRGRNMEAPVTSAIRFI